MVKNSSKKPGPAGRLTAVAKECAEKGLSQAEARSHLIDKLKASEAVAKSTVSYIYTHHKPASRESPQ